MKTALALLATAWAASAAYVFPVFKQCDPRWGNNEMGVNGPGERSTICGEGCAMSSVSMALNGLGVEINGQASNPGTLNAWLEANNGYMCAGGDCNNLILDMPGKVPGSPLSLVGENPKQPASVIVDGILSQSFIYVAHVRNNTHFVLLTGVAPSPQGETYFTVNDPNYNTTAYSWDAITDIIVYKINPRKPMGAPALTPVIPYPMPLYKQCDSRWGNDIIETTTICAVGCLMSSTSMALAGRSIQVAGQTSNPGTLNAWLRANGGYTQGNDLEEDVVPKVDPARVSWPADAMHTTNDIPIPTIQDMLRGGRPVIANVMQGRHFVLVVGWDANNTDTLLINDPGFDRVSYSYSNDVVGWRLFNMTFPAHLA